MGAGASTQKLHLKQRKEGDAVPDVTIKARVRIAETEAVSSFQWRDISTSDLFKGKRVVVFSIPGGMNWISGMVLDLDGLIPSLLPFVAFTPVCSCDHLPSYIDRYGRRITHYFPPDCRVYRVSRLSRRNIEDGHRRDLLHFRKRRLRHAAMGRPPGPERR
jgi:hypothetical protein